MKEGKPTKRPNIGDFVRDALYSGVILAPIAVAATVMPEDEDKPQTTHAQKVMAEKADRLVLKERL